MAHGTWKSTASVSLKRLWTAQLATSPERRKTMVHIDDHGNEWSFFCPECNLPFQQSYDFHVREYHGNEAV